MDSAFNLNESRHLSHKEMVNLGSFYTPYKYVMLAGEWLLSAGVDASCTILDSSCGYGAFFALSEIFPKNRFLGNDIDPLAIEKIPSVFPFVEVFGQNALLHVKRANFGLSDEEKLVIVGNPPYNDTTSQVNQKIKETRAPMDADLRTRDLGLSSLLSYNKLKADFALVLHPLSYLIKRANFRAGSRFFENYSLEKHIVFSSREFANTSKLHGFPIVMALYKRCEGSGLHFDDIRDLDFQTVEGNVFNLSRRDYVADFIEKYPHKKRYSPEILFYTLRDINALVRSRTFIPERIANAVDVDPGKLAYYCYIDCFKKFAAVPYYMGNFDVPFIRKDFENVAESVVAVSKYGHPEVFGRCEEPSADDLSKVKNYVERAVSYR